MKKFLSIALSTAMAFSMFASVAFGAEKELTTQDKYDALTKAGIFSGYPDGTAGLDKNMTRGQFAKVVAKLLSLEDDAAASSKYVDVKANNWAAPFIGSVSKAGLMEGSKNQKGQLAFDFNGNVTVEQMAKVLVIALKLEVPATAENGASAWAKGYVDAAVKAGLIPADANFKAAATREQLVLAAYTASVEIEKQKVTYEVKVVDANNIQVTFSDAKDKPESFKLEKALEANKENTVTVKRANGEEKTLKFTWTITDATKVESVSADNLKEVTVKFDGTVDKESAETKGNYSIDNVSFKSATLSADKKTVVLLIDGSDALVNQNEVTLKVSDIKTETNGKTISQDVKFTPLDKTIPTVAEVKALGTSAFKVTFSEPVKGLNTTSNFKVDGKTISGYVNDDSLTAKSVIIEADLTVGEHELTVGSGVTDYVPFAVDPSPVKFTVVEDKEAPTVVSAKSSDLKKVELEFNEPIKSIGDVYFNSTDNKGTATISDNKVTVTFDKAMNVVETTIFMKNVTDFSGNKADRETKITPEIDTVKPTVKSVKVKSEASSQTYTVEFSKDVDAASAKKGANYTFKDKDGKVVSGKGLDSDGHPVVDIEYADKKATIKLVGKLAAGKYTIEVAGVFDKAVVANTMLPYSTTVDVADAEAPTVSKVWYEEKDVTVSGASKYDTAVFVQFDKDMATDGKGSVLDAMKYNYSNATNTSFIPLPKDSSIELVSPNTVKVKFARSDAKIAEGKNLKLRLSFVADKKDNFLNASGTSTDSAYTFATAVIEAKGAQTVAIDGGTGKVVSDTQIKVTFKGKLSNINAADFLVEDANGNTLELNRVKHEFDGGDTIVTFALKGDAKFPKNKVTDYKFKTVAQADIKSVDVNGFKVAQVLPIVVKDGVAPEATKYDDVKSFLVTNETATGATYNYDLKVTFDEAIKVATGTNGYGAIVVKVNGDKQTIVSLDRVTNVVADNTLLVKFNFGRKLADNDTVEISLLSVNDTNKIVTDAGDNAAKTFTKTALFSKVN